MAGDNLFAILGMIRAELGDAVTDETWAQLKRLLADRAGGGRVYVPRPSSKTARLEALAQASDDIDNTRLAQLLGVSVRHAKRLRRLTDR